MFRNSKIGSNLTEKTMKGHRIEYTCLLVTFVFFYTCFVRCGGVGYLNSNWIEANGGPVCESVESVKLAQGHSTGEVHSLDANDFRNNYENNMRVSAVQCCRYASTGAVSGFKMKLAAIDKAYTD